MDVKVYCIDMDMELMRRNALMNGAQRKKRSKMPKQNFQLAQFGFGQKPVKIVSIIPILQFLQRLIRLH